MPRIRTILLAGATLYIVLSTFVATVNHVPTTSMENTIKAGSVILIDQITYGACMPRLTRQCSCASASWQCRATLWR